MERIDVAEAVRLVKSAIHQAATDPRTGQIDMDLLTTGTSMASRMRIGDLSRAVAEALRGAGNITLDALLAKVQLHSDVVRLLFLCASVHAFMNSFVSLRRDPTTRW